MSRTDVNLSDANGIANPLENSVKQVRVRHCSTETVSQAYHSNL
jgi:hypothetical protein